MSRYVFVYGTLKSGHGNHGVMANTAGAEFIGDFSTPPCYTMVSFGGFPGIVPIGNTSIKGELWAVDDVSQLDRLEGHPTFYQRTNIVLREFDKPVEVYILNNKPYTETTKSLQIVASGEW